MIDWASMILVSAGAGSILFIGIPWMMWNKGSVGPAVALGGGGIACLAGALLQFFA